MSVQRRLRRGWRAVNRAAQRLGLDAALFRLSRMLLGALLGGRRRQRLLIPRRAAQMARFLTQTGLAAQHAPAATLRQHLLEQRLAATYYHQLYDPQYAQALQARAVVNGWPHVTQAQQAGRGILFVLSHYGLSRAAIAYLAGRGLRGPVIRMRTKARLAQAGGDQSGVSQLLQSARDLAAAQLALEQGGCALIVADGSYGRPAATLPFYGRQRHFRAGFAELALATGARVIPVTAVTDAAGHLLITFYPALTVSDGQHEARVADLIAQYADHLRAIWAASPGSIQTNIIRRYLAGNPRQYAPPAESAP